MFPGLRSMETKHLSCSPLVCSPKKHHKQQCVRNNVSSFAIALMKARMEMDYNMDELENAALSGTLFSQIFNDHGIVPFTER